MFVNMGNNMKGFTLIELMIVLAIIAILSAIAIPLYDGYAERSAKAELDQELANFAAVQEDYFNSYRKYSGNLAELADYYGVTVQGTRFVIKNLTVGSGAGSYSVDGYVCYSVPVASCGAGANDYYCKLQSGQEQPVCTKN